MWCEYCKGTTDPQSEELPNCISCRIEYFVVKEKTMNTTKFKKGDLVRGINPKKPAYGEVVAISDVIVRKTTYAIQNTGLIISDVYIELDEEDLELVERKNEHE